MRLKNKNTKFGRGQITNVWEVKLLSDTKEKIRKLAVVYKVSMSWIVRYCLFQLVHQDCKNLAEDMQDVIIELKENQRDVTDRKRLFLCLYGDDEMHLRITASQAHLTVSMLVRLALYMYLGALEKSKSSYDNLFWCGLKYTKEMKNYTPVVDLGSVQEFLSRKLFDFHDFWGIPPNTKGRVPPAA